MPKARPKTRVIHLADALAAAQRIQDALSSIDLRTTPEGPLRELVHAARGQSQTLGMTLADALRSDVPTLPEALVAR